MQCPMFPKRKVREIISRTEKTGKEHAFVACADGSTSDIVEGGRSALNIEEGVNECDLSNGPVEIVHTHPNGVAELSEQDRKVAADDDVEAVCVAVQGGEVKCEMVESCSREVA